MEKAISDMYLAAVLVAYGAELGSIDRTNPRRQKFIFTKPPFEIYVQDGNHMVRVEEPSLEDVEVKFINKMLWYPPNYPDAIRQVRSNIYNYNDDSN